MSNPATKSDSAAVDLALAVETESERIEFKAFFNPTSSSEWLELIKDIVAISNTGGGILVIGLHDDGTPSGADVSAVLSLDPAEVTNKIYKYTDHQFHGFRFVPERKGNHQLCAIVVAGAEIPVVFAKVGTYAVEANKQKTAFSAGTVYFRHGAKSEPGNSDDLRYFLDRRLEVIRNSWMQGITKVVEAPVGSRMVVLPAEVHESTEPDASAIRLVDDPSAPAYYAMPVDKTHPHRQKDVAESVNARLDGKRAAKSYDIFCIRKVYKVDDNRTFCYTQRHASPLYSERFVDWIVEQLSSNPEFFEDTRARFKQIHMGNTD